MSELAWLVVAAIWAVVLAPLLSPVVERCTPVVWAWEMIRALVVRVLTLT